MNPPRYRLPVVIRNPKSPSAAFAAARFVSRTTRMLLLGSGKYPRAGPNFCRLLSNCFQMAVNDPPAPASSAYQG
eukprot:scaffold11661_cov30-Attheya_sp.AAC.2